MPPPAIIQSLSDVSVYGPAALVHIFALIVCLFKKNKTQRKNHRGLRENALRILYPSLPVEAPFDGLPPFSISQFRFFSKFIVGSYHFFNSDQLLHLLQTVVHARAQSSRKRSTQASAVLDLGEQNRLLQDISLEFHQDLALCHSPVNFHGVNGFPGHILHAVNNLTKFYVCFNFSGKPHPVDASALVGSG